MEITDNRIIVRIPIQFDRYDEHIISINEWLYAHDFIRVGLNTFESRKSRQYFRRSCRESYEFWFDDKDKDIVELFILRWC